MQVELETFLEAHLFVYLGGGGIGGLGGGGGGKGRWDASLCSHVLDAQMLPANRGVCQIPLLTTLEIEWGMALSIACVAYVLGQHISDFDPQFARSIRTISVVVEKHATIISVALRNAQLGSSG